MIQVAGRAYRGVKNLEIRQTFDTWEDLQKSVIDYGVQQERVVVTKYKDATKYCGRCRMFGTTPSSCKWYVRAIKSLKTSLITITGFHGIHTCDRADHYERRMHTRSNRLADHVIDILMENKTTRACCLRDTLKAQVHPDVKYHSAHAARVKCLTRLNGKEKDSFYLIPTHLQRILDRDPTAVARWRAPNGHFTNLFVCPSVARHAYGHCRPLIALDGAHTRGSYPQMLLLATCLDANNTVVLLAYGMAPGENTQEWDWFLQLLVEAIPKLCEGDTVFMSDREKGLLTTMDDIFPAGHHAFCIWHIKQNMRTAGFSKEVTKMFDRLVYAVTPEQFEGRLQRIEEKGREAAEYIKNTADPAHYSRAFFPTRRWGKESSQQAEAQNEVLKPERMVVALQSSCMLWDYMMRQFYEKKKLAESVNTLFAPNIMLELNDIELRAHRLLADPSTDYEVRITDEAGREFLVKLYPDWFCSCGDFQDKLIPCVHAFRAISVVKKKHKEFVDHKYTTRVFRETYSRGLPALLKDDLERNPHCGPALKVRKRGRPSEKSRLRFKEDRTEHAVRRCRVCAMKGHDKRNCPQWKGVRAAVAAEHDIASEDVSNSESGESNESGDNGDYLRDFDESEPLELDTENLQPNVGSWSESPPNQSSQFSMPLPSSQLSFGSGPFSQLLSQCSNPWQ